MFLMEAIFQFRQAGFQHASRKAALELKRIDSRAHPENLIELGPFLWVKDLGTCLWEKYYNYIVQSPSFISQSQRKLAHITLSSLYHATSIVFRSPSENVEWRVQLWCHLHLPLQDNLHKKQATL